MANNVTLYWYSDLDDVGVGQRLTGNKYVVWPGTNYW